MNNLTRVIIRTLIFTFFVILIDNTIQVHFFGTTANCRESNQIVNNSGIDMSTGMPIEPEELSPQTDLIYQTSFISSREFWLSLIILLFGLIVICAEYSLLKSKAVTAEEILKIFAVTLIVVGTLFLITASFNNNQIAPAMGLFGTIAGYLLGKKQIGRKMIRRFLSMKKKISILIAIFIGVSLFFVKISASGEFMMTFGKSDLPDDSILLSNNSTYELSFLLSNDDKKWQRLLLRSNKSAVISYREKGGTKYKQYYIKIDSGKHPKHFVLAINMRYGVYWDDHFKSWQVIHSGAN